MHLIAVVKVFVTLFRKVYFLYVFKVILRKSGKGNIFPISENVLVLIEFPAEFHSLSLGGFKVRAANALIYPVAAVSEFVHAVKERKKTAFFAVFLELVAGRGFEPPDLRVNGLAENKKEASRLMLLFFRYIAFLVFIFPEK